MSLKHITFTGIDTKTDIKALQEIQSEYPYVEFGVLVSKNWRERGNRYPNPAMFDKLAFSGLNLSCHVCGSYARNITRALDWSGLLSLLGQNYDIFDRCQINISTSEPTERTFFLKTPKFFKEIIIQQKSVYEHSTWDAINWHGFMSMILDASGGRGIDTPIEILNGDYKVGYAGGLNPDNVGDKLSYIMGNVKGDFWIDMESGVRTNDWLDLNKVVKVLEICKPIIEKGSQR